MTYLLELLFQLCPTMVILLIVLSSCEKCLDQVRYIGFVLHNIEKNIDDERINTLTENFSLQILHEPLIFTTGFFDMDFMFLKTIIASITTYMVIFIQFMPKTEISTEALITANQTRAIKDHKNEYEIALMESHRHSFESHIVPKLLCCYFSHKPELKGA
ncbi:CLUMA_CG001930, isoform A [Clunio marinus]|uniref:CLUMA_CG001930, isoform A n=1 Tax=Clunio marinus TaxID=568069 RepID=A0A1J1HPK4_9DIPT|nr:CLUMA_CG001930, isoform A [Clunio marinus]